MARTRPFEEHAKRYERWFEDNQAAYLSELEAVRRLLPARGEGMEVGVGSGRFAEPLGIREGVEPSAAMRELSAKRGINAVDGVAESLPYRSERFDSVLMVTTICFVDDALEAFREANRVLKRGGSIVVGFVDRASALGGRYESGKTASVFYREATFFTTAEVLALLERTGFRQPEAVQTVFGRLSRVKSVQDVEPGYGEGGFVAIRAVKP